MKTFDKIFFGLLIGAVLPVSLFFTGWWSTFKIVLENQIIIFALAGFVIGIILDFLFLRRVISNLYEINTSNLILVYVFYSLCCFGFFMGVPVFNVLLGILAGYYVAARCAYSRRDIIYTEHFFRQTAIFTSVIMSLVSVVSATIALSDPFTPKNIKGMLGLNFDITKMVLLLIIVFGGAVLIVVQFFLTKYTAIISYRIFGNEIRG